MATLLVHAITGEATPSLRYRSLLDVPDCPKCGQLGMHADIVYLLPQAMRERYGEERDGLLLVCGHCHHEIAVMDCKDRVLEVANGTD